MNRTLHWQKSSFSGGAEGNECVELAATPTTIHLRESDTPTPLAQLLDAIHTGAFTPCP